MTDSTERQAEMPVDIDKSLTIAPGGSTLVTRTPGVTPKFFHRDLTGTGKGPRGLINDLLRPGSLTRAPLNAELVLRCKGSSRRVTTREIPFAAVNRRWYEVSHSAVADLSIDVPVDEAFEPTADMKSSPIDVLVDLDPHGAVLVKKEDSDDDKRRFDVLYRLTVFVKDRSISDWPVSVPLRRSGSTNAAEPFALTMFSWSPGIHLTKLLTDATSSLSPSVPDLDVSVQWTEYLNEYPLYERIVAHARTWSSDEIGTIISDLLHRLRASAPAGQGFTDIDRELIELQLRSMESYGVPLSAYRDVYTALSKISHDAGELESFSRTNQNLMLNQGLVALENVKDQLPRPSRETPAQTPAQMAPQAPQKPFRASPQQKAAITTDEPCSLVQAAAGSGKTTVIGERISYLQEAGVNLSDITVLSFTNAAADNVTLRYPGVNSMTSSAMVNAIYKHNFPRQEISSTHTLVNCLLSFYGKSDDVIAEFARLLRATENNEDGSYTELASFISVRLADVVKVLDHVKLVTLPLQSIIAYIAADIMKEPAGTVGRYFIVDEVQDNSVFDFIYLLKHVTKHRASLFMVGDASQTLYEFRSANPKALNALESSGVFATYQLATNYRSIEEILLMANGSLMDIEANRFAKIQMHAHQMRRVSADSFREAVQLEYHWTKSQKEFWESDLPGMLNTPSSNIRRWLDARVGSGQQVALLAPYRRQAFALQDQLKALYPHLKIGCMTSEKATDSTVFSAFVRDHWDLVCQVDHHHAAFVVWEEVMNTLQTPGDKAKADALVRMVSDIRAQWWTQTQGNEAVWRAAVDAGTLDLEGYRAYLRDSLIEFETRTNSIRARVTGMKNQERKAGADLDSADVLTGTVHSAKGLEFPHVAVFQKYSNDMSEGDKRLYYVALTRAQDSEFIMSNGTVEHAMISDQYEVILSGLMAQEDPDAPQSALSAALESSARREAAQQDPQIPADLPATDADGVIIDDDGAPAETGSPMVVDTAAAFAGNEQSVAAPWDQASAPVTTAESQENDTVSDQMVNAPWASMSA